MKTSFIFLAFVLGLNLSAQLPNPNCSHLRVNNLQMDNDTANLMKVTLANTCTNCASGINGCVYLQLEVIRTVSPFDTLASSKCWCLWSPSNSSQRTYGIVSKVASLPALNTLRVALIAGACGCDTIPFALVTDLAAEQTENSIQVYPNPVHDFVEISSKINAERYILVTDVTGKMVLRKKLEQNQMKVDLSQLSKGYYDMEILDENKVVIKKSKIIKD